jgi:D-alanyl-D-alanine dipeptidase
MLHTKRVQDNPHWLDEPALLSSPGSGAHPRGMAIDVSLEDEGGTLLDMGTDFDFLADDPNAEANPAHRDHPNLDATTKKNRKMLDDAMFTAAATLGIPLIGLPQEWWDYRLPLDIYSQYAPLRDSDLPEIMRLCR